VSVFQHELSVRIEDRSGLGANRTQEKCLMLVGYKASGKLGLLSILLVPALLTGVAMLAWLDSLLLRKVPIIYAGVFIAAGFAVAVGFAVALVVWTGKCRNMLAGVAIGLVAGVVAVAAGHYWNYVETVGAAGQPITLAEYFKVKAATGWRLGRAKSGIPITGFWVYAIWTIEALATLIAGVIGGVGASDSPFCEACDTWADKSKKTVDLPGLSDASLAAAKAATEFEQLVTLPLSEIKPSPRRLAFVVKGCPKCDQCMFLNVLVKDEKPGDEGKTEETEEELHQNIVLEPWQVEALTQLESDVQAVLDHQVLSTVNPDGPARES